MPGFTKGTFIDYKFNGEPKNPKDKNIISSSTIIQGYTNMISTEDIAKEVKSDIKNEFR